MLSVWKKGQFQKTDWRLLSLRKLSDDQRKRFSKTENARCPIVPNARAKVCRAFYKKGGGASGRNCGLFSAKIKVGVEKSEMRKKR